MTRKELSDYPIEILVLKAVRKEVPVDDLLNTRYSTKDFDRLAYWLPRSYIENYGYERCWSDNAEKYDMMYLCKLLYDAKMNRNIAEYQESLLFKEEESIDLSMDWDDADENIAYADNAYDALILSLSERGKVDITYIASSARMDPDEVIDSLADLIYQDPEHWHEDPYMGWVTSDEYLSGNMYRKLIAAEKADASYPGRFAKNVDAILDIYPQITDFKDIYVALGTPWVPTDIIDDFIEHILGVSDMSDRKKNITKHDPLSGTWEVVNGGRYRGLSVSMCRTWGTGRCDAFKVLSDCLNMKQSIVYDEKWGVKSNGEHGYILEMNKEETALAQEKQKQMNEEFKKWVWRDERRKNRLLDVYEERYGSYVKRRYDGSFLKFPGMDPSIRLYDYQKDVVARILFSKNTLLAHDVGSGKTYEMIAAGMEMRRIRKSRKNLYVVPNNITGQWKEIFLKLYPEAKVLVIEPKGFRKEKRQKVLAEIRDSDYDGIIMAYSCFDMIPMSDRFLMWQLQRQRVDVEQSMGTVTGDVSSLDRRHHFLSGKILKLKDSMSDDKGICFDDLKINTLFLDEAHNYKNISLNTKMNNVLGIHTNGSKKCDAMADKIAYVQKTNNGGGIVLATGTPITNSLSEAFVLQKFLQPGELKLLDLECFDSWAGMFAETNTDYEIDVTSNSYRLATRISKYHNVKELTSLFSSVADFHKVDKVNEIPEFDGYTDVLVKKSADLQKILDEISKRAERVRKHYVSKEEDNMLKITIDGRKAALDLRLLNEEEYAFSAESKIASCAKNVFREYCLGKFDQATQLVFCDSSTPKDRFNLYDELTRLLEDMGVPRKEIAYIHDATNDKQRCALYEKVRKGEIRILIGSTAKLGMGVNVQERVRALHHLDIPWRPSDMVQREGRILRKGNLNKSVNIYRYITEGSFDAYLWQLLEMKQRFIDQLVSGSLDKRDLDEVSEMVLSYAEVKALSVGEPQIRKRIELLNEIARLKMIRSQNALVSKAMEKELQELPARIRIFEDLLDKAEEDLNYIQKHAEVFSEENSDERNNYRVLIEKGLKGNVLMPEDRSLMVYKGFDVFLPKQMSEADPYLILIGCGRYQVKMGDSFVGNLVRLDNFFESFEEKIVERYRKELDGLKRHMAALRNELDKKDDVPDKIDQLMLDLKKINKEMKLNYVG